MTILKSIGLMTVREHEADTAQLERSYFDALTQSAQWEAKFKQAVTDLEKNDVEIAELKADLAASRDQVAELLPDALAMRRKRQMDRDRKAAKREGV